MRTATSTAGVIAAAFLLLHLPFLPSSLEDLDSINFALGIRDFDVTQHQPHPPGYPVLILAAKAVHRVGVTEAHALSLLSIVSGALSAFALVSLFRRLDENPGAADSALMATALTVSAPLYWFTAARPLSDMTGLAAAVAVQAFTLSIRTGTALALAALFAGLAGGIRSQVIWLTLPLLILVAARRPRQHRLEDALVALGALLAGVLVWLVPMVWLNGGPAEYLKALSNQGSEDLTGVGMLWTTPTPRQLVLAFNSVVVAPWGTPILAAVSLLLAVAGVARMALKSRQALWFLCVAFGPYLTLDLLFQETVTTRYSLPLVVPFAFLTVRGALFLPRRFALAIVGLLIAAGVAIAVPSVQAYASTEAPAFRLLSDMRASSPTLGAPPVLATHRREELDLRRPITWMGENMAAFSQRLPATPKHEWLELVNYWNLGGRAPMWFVADPLRSDLALVDHPPPRSYRWPLAFPILLGGIRPNEMDWYAIDSPSWYLGEGWALTPETGGVAKADGRGPGLNPIRGWIRRRSEPVTVMIGGRNLGVAEATLTLSINGTPWMNWSIPPGFFLRMLQPGPEHFAGDGEYSELGVQAGGDVAIEQFDAQGPEKVVFGYGEGWHEREYDSSLGRTWRWMSEHGTLQVRGTGQPFILALDGVTENFARPSRLTIRAGDRVVLQQEIDENFSVRARIPADVFGQLGQGDGVITIETDQVYVPAEQASGSADRRHLGLKVFECQMLATPL